MVCWKAMAGLYLKKRVQASTPGNHRFLVMHQGRRKFPNFLWLKIKAVSLLPNWKGHLLFHFSRKMIFQSQSTILCLKKNTLNCWPNSIRREPLWRKIVKRLKSKMQIWINFVVSVRI